MTQISNNFEGGSNGTVISTVNAGGGGNTLFDFSGGGSAEVFSTSAAYYQSLGMSINTAASEDCRVGWVGGTTRGLTDEYVRFYMKFTQIPTANSMPLFDWYDSAFNRQGAIYLNHLDGKLYNIDPSTPLRDSTSASLSANTWYRVECHLTLHATLTQMQTKVFLSESTTALYDYGFGTTWAVANTTNDKLFMGATGVANYPAAANFLYLDEIVVGATTWVGPVIPVVTSTFLPQAARVSYT